MSQHRGGSRISVKGVISIRVGGSLCCFYLIFLKYLMKWNNLVSLRPNYFIFIGYLKTWARERVQANRTPSGSAILAHDMRKPPINAIADMSCGLESNLWSESSSSSILFACEQQMLWQYCAYVRSVWAFAARAVHVYDKYQNIIHQFQNTPKCH